MSDTILVMMTSLANRGDVRRLEEAGFSAYLTKPVKKSVLYGCLVTVYSGKGRPSDGPGKRIVTQHLIVERRRRRARILLAEDNSINQKVALAMLEKLGFRADVVANGEEAVKALEAVPYDLVLMDCQMPEMDGFEATRAIRGAGASVRNPNVPIVAMTAGALEGDREACIEAGMDDYIPKPVSPQALAEMLEKWLSEAEKPGPSDSTPETPPPEEAFDRAGMMERLGGDEELAREIMVLFLEDAPRRMELLREGLEEQDAPQVRLQAHTLKGAGGNLGAVALQEVAFQIENAAEAGDLGRAGDLVPQLEAQFERFKDAWDLGG